jgi:hypothetical protein
VGSGAVLEELRAAVVSLRNASAQVAAVSTAVALKHQDFPHTASPTLSLARQLQLLFAAYIKRFADLLSADVRRKVGEICEASSLSSAAEKGRRRIFVKTTTAVSFKTVTDEILTGVLEPFLGCFENRLDTRAVVLLFDIAWGAAVDALLDALVSMGVALQGGADLMSIVAPLTSDWLPGVKRRLQVGVLVLDRTAFSRARAAVNVLAGQEARATALGMSAAEQKRWEALLRPKRSRFRGLLGWQQCFGGKHSATVAVEIDLDSKVL